MPQIERRPEYDHCLPQLGAKLVAVIMGPDLVARGMVNSTMIERIAVVLVEPDIIYVESLVGTVIYVIKIKTIVNYMPAKLSGA